MPTIAYPYQKKGVRKIEHFGGRALLADEMGLGKTLQSLLWCQQHPEARPIVVVCRASVKFNWEREAAMHIGLRAEVLEGTKPPKQKAIHAPSMFIINYDILSKWLKYLKRFKPKVVIIDECQDVANRDTVRAKACRALISKVPHVIALSGTPFTNRPVELWSVLNMVRPDIWPRNSFGNYARRYCKPVRRRWGWEFKGATRLPELNALLNQHLMIRRLKEDVLKELPPKKRVMVSIDLKPTERDEYKEAVRDFIGWLAKVSPRKAKRAAKAERVVRLGYLKRLIGRLKLRYVMEWVDKFHAEHPTEKLILFGVHKAVLKPLIERYKSGCVFIDGSVTGRLRQQAIDVFAKRRRTWLLIGNNKAAGVGWNGTVARHVAICEFGWTPGEHRQLEDRAHRIGQHREVFCHYLIVQDTLEEWLCELLETKQNVLSQVLDGAKTAGDLDLFELLTTKLKSSVKSNKEQSHANGRRVSKPGHPLPKRGPRLPPRLVPA